MPGPTRTRPGAAIADLLAGSGTSSVSPLPHGPGRGQAGLVVLASEQALAGPLDQDVLALAGSRLQELRRDGGVRLLVVGRRGLRQFAARGLVPDDAQPGATSVEGLRDLARRIARRLGDCLAAGDIRSLAVVHARFESLGRQIPAEERIFPVDLERLRPLRVAAGEPYRYLPTRDLLDGLVSEYAFIRLYRIAADAFASEQAARLAATDAAARNVERRLEGLRAIEMQARREAITRQVLELIAARMAHGRNGGSHPRTG